MLMDIRTGFELYGKSEVISVLSGKFSAGRFPHAVLFTGAAGVGKTVLSCYGSMVLLCDKQSSDFVPCGVCRSCRKILSGCHPDVIDALSLTDEGKYTADFIRGIVADGGVRPNDGGQEGGIKVYIFRELGGMSVICQNLLLKFIEEPPSYVRFFCTCDSDGIGALLPTVRSRLTAVPVMNADLTPSLFYEAVRDISETKRESRLRESDESERRAASEKQIMSGKKAVKSRKKSLKATEPSNDFDTGKIPGIAANATPEEIGERLYQLSGGNIGAALDFASGGFSEEYGIATAAANALATGDEYSLGAALSKLSERRDLFRRTLVFLAEIMKDAAALRHLRDTGYRKGDSVDLTGVFSRYYDDGSKRIAGAYSGESITRGTEAVSEFLAEIEFNVNFNIKLGCAVCAAKIFEQLTRK
ncbi:hypothetical protein FACS1894120_1980 [Clostridia bacterium]|nr:hypothetical protein FACS1894120_1980 [Clostridia bacterium]